MLGDALHRNNGETLSLLKEEVKEKKGWSIKKASAMERLGKDSQIATAVVFAAR